MAYGETYEDTSLGFWAPDYSMSMSQIAPGEHDMTERVRQQQQQQQPPTNPLTAKLDAWRKAGSEVGARIDEGDANVFSDPRFQSWSVGQAMPSSMLPQQESASGLPNPSAGAPKPIAAFTQQFNRPMAESLLNLPGYIARQDAARRGQERSAAARGTLLTGGTQEALMQRSQDIASQEYGNEYSRALGEYMNAFQIHNSNEGNRFNSERGIWNDVFSRDMQTQQFGLAEQGQAFDQNRANRLDDFNIWNSMDSTQYARASELARMGLSSEEILARLGAVSASEQGGLITDAAAARGAGQMGSANAWSDFLGAGGSMSGGLGIDMWSRGVGVGSVPVSVTNGEWRPR